MLEGNPWAVLFTSASQVFCSAAAGCSASPVVPAVPDPHPDPRLSPAAS